MQVHIDNTLGRAVYLQIIDHVKRDIALGRLVEGDRLPTVRELAVTLAINPNTIAKAYRQLEQEGIIMTKAGAGAFVANLDKGLNKSVKRRLITEEFQRIVVDAYHMHVDEGSLREWFDNVVNQFDLPVK
jgi:GntR family transcriptional regulator